MKQTISIDLPEGYELKFNKETDTIEVTKCGCVSEKDFQTKYDLQTISIPFQYALQYSSHVNEDKRRIEALWKLLQLYYVSEPKVPSWHYCAAIKVYQFEIKVIPIKDCPYMFRFTSTRKAQEFLDKNRDLFGVVSPLLL